MKTETDWRATAIPVARVGSWIHPRRPLGIRPIQIVATSGSGNGRAVDTARRLQEALRARGRPVALEVFREFATLRRWAASGRVGASLVIGVGGDGTQSTAAAAAVRGAIPFLSVPSGFGNLFARAFGHVDDVDRAADLVDLGTLVHADVGMRNGWPFLDQESFGFVADIQAHAEAFRRYPQARWRRWLAYYRGAVRYLRHAALPALEVTVDGRLVTRRAAVVTVANVATYDPWLRLTPEASPVDGLLDVLVLEAPSKPALLAKLLRRHLRVPGTDPDTRLYRGRRVAVMSPPLGRDLIDLLPGRLPVLVSTETARRLHRDGQSPDGLAGGGDRHAA
jgi:diacylglycerol kinase (ATP)